MEFLPRYQNQQILPPGGKLVKTKADVTSYLAIMQTIVNAMDKSKMKKINNFKKMEDDLTHIIEEAWFYFVFSLQ